MNTETYMTIRTLTLEDGTVIGKTDIAGRRGDSKRLGAMPDDTYDLAAEYQDLHEDTTVYLGDELAS